MFNFYKNKETNEIISRGELTSTDGWREKLDNGIIVRHSEYHPILDGLEVVKVECEFSNPTEETDYMVVPIKMLLDNIPNRVIWEGCPRLMNNEILECISSIKESGDYPYNKDVAKAFCEKFGVEGGEHDLLSAIIFGTQSYVQLKEDEVYAKKLHEEMTNDGYQKLTEDMVDSIANTKRRFKVYLNATNMFGSDIISESDGYLYLRSDNRGGYLWMKPRATRNGFAMNLGQYVKEVTK